MTSSVKMLFVGLGSAGRRHWRNFTTLQGGDALFYRTRTTPLPDPAAGKIPVYSSLSAALDQAPTAAVIANPTALHVETALACIEAGCHVLIEKPLAHGLDGIDTLTRLVDERGSRVLVGYQFRFHPGLRAIKQWIDAGEVGQVASARVVWGEYLPLWHPWEDYRQGYAARAELGGGVTLTLSHPLDYLRWLFGEVVDVCGMTGARGGLELADVEDTADVLLRFANGIQANVHVDYLRQPPLHRMEIIGERGTISWESMDGIARLYREAEAKIISVPPVDFERNQMSLAQMRHFLAVVHGEEQPICTLADGVAALKIALKALGKPGIAL